jgi:glycosyltransferase involved in cell wall biosynthesis
MRPLVSIIIPCHNAARWLEATLESAQAQEGAELEIIIVDDGSTDGSAALARHHAGPSLRILSQARSGAAAARNHGLREARGAFIQFLDADDLLLPGKIALQLERLLPAGPGHIASGEWARFHAEPASAVFAPYPNHRDLSGVEFLQLCFEQETMMQPGAWLAPRALLEQAGPWDERLSLNDDGEYFARVVLKSKGILFCPGSRTAYRSGLPGSLSRSRSRRHLESAFLAADSICTRLLAADSSERSRAAAAYAWKWLAFELYPGAGDLSDEALARSGALGGSPRPFPAGPAFRRLSRLLGWRLAKRVRDWRLGGRQP